MEIAATPSTLPKGTSATRPTSLPGDRRGKAKIARMMRVDQAGEVGATEIYFGQMAVLQDRPCAHLLQEMAEQEQEHLATFNKILTERGIRPTALSPLWRLAGFTLGAGSALLGERAAMATTVAVEEVIEAHYQRQLEELAQGSEEASAGESAGDSDGESNGYEAELRAVIAEFREDELNHRDLALENGAEEAPAYQILSQSVKAGTRMAIWLAERI